MTTQTLHVRWLFFDLDGTLADSLPGLEQSIREALASTGRRLQVADLRPYIGPGIRVILRNLDATIQDDGELDRMEQAFRASYDTSGVRSTEMFREADATLRRLKASGHTLFVVTNKPRLATTSLLAQHRLMELFAEVVSRNSREPAYTSKGEMLRDAMARHGAVACESLMVGDTDEDRQAAEEAGLSFVHARYGYGAVPSGCATISDISELGTLCAMPVVKV